MVLDRYGRNLHYLRVSLTDRCNLRCIYCMPEDIRFRPRSELMRDEEVLTFVRVFASLGFDTFRLTGGEPTLRPGVVDLVRAIAAIEGVRTLTMTTNGIGLAELAEPLAEAGLQRVNVSLDTLDRVRFRALTRRGDVEEVLAGVQAAERAGLTPVKINVVVVCEFNLEDVVELARLTLDHPWQVRFIEQMPFAGLPDAGCDRLVSGAEVYDRLESALGPMVALHGGALVREARLFRLSGAPGTIGFINTVTQPFCASCTRARLTADGRLRLCLLQDDEVDLLGPWRSGLSEQALRSLVRQALWRKPWGHRLGAGEIPQNRWMNEIGG